MADLVAFGPSLVDIAARLPQDRFDSCGLLLGATAGEWRRIHDYGTVRLLIRELTGRDIPLGAELPTLLARLGLAVTAGSSTLGMLSAMPAEVRRSSTYVSSVGCTEGVLDSFSRFFISSLEAAQVQHRYFLAEGRNPIGFVLSSSTNPEKMLAMYPGVAERFDGFDLTGLSPQLILLDTYELLGGELSQFLHQCISRTVTPIALSLGNRHLLHGHLRRQLRRYVSARRLTILCGNAEEYEALFPEVDPALCRPSGFRHHPIRQVVPFALMTFGTQGLACHWDGHYVFADAVPIAPSQIVNTSGAGDTAAGVFCSGVLRGDPPQQTLDTAAELSAHVLQVHSSRILAA
ncbi:carbohydrate kinase family protein [Micromonospora sp. GCM10011542]|uniref:carbohydrate kinase family protein n=1 Tax=Micromonospora sp. GCM10011542 TaxID=3317337 RepID=UPI00361B76E2